MGEFDFFDEFLTFQLFRILEEQSDNIPFEWFKIIHPNEERRGQPIITTVMAGNTNLNFGPTLRKEIIENNITEDWFDLAQQCVYDFIFSMTEHYSIRNVEVGILKIFTTPIIIDPITRASMVRILYRIAPMNFYGVPTRDKVFIKKPKEFRLTK